MSLFSPFRNALVKMGLVISEDAEPEEMVKAIEGAPTMEEMKTSITSELSTQFESQISLLTSENEGLKNSLTDVQGKYDQVKAENDTMIIAASEAKTQIESLQAENSQLQKDKTELSGKLAGRIASALTTHDEPPKYEKSQTEKDWQARNAELKKQAAESNAKID